MLTYERLMAIILIDGKITKVTILFCRIMFGRRRGRPRTRAPEFPCEEEFSIGSRGEAENVQDSNQE